MSTKKSTREVSTKQEKFLEKILGARRTPNSGATWKSKGDLHDTYSVFEAKTSMTKKQQYTVKKDDLKEVQRDKFIHNKQFGFLVFDYGEPTYSDTYVTMSLDDFITLYDTFKEANDFEEGI